MSDSFVRRTIARSLNAAVLPHDARRLAASLLLLSSACTGVDELGASDQDSPRGQQNGAAQITGAIDAGTMTDSGAGGREPSADAGVRMYPNSCYSRGNLLFRGHAANFHPSERYDYIALRDQPINASPSDKGWIQSAVGTPCSTATDTAACLTRVASWPRTPLVCPVTGSPCFVRQIITTRGDEVRHWAGRDALLALLAPIDTVDEASQLLNYAGFELECSKAPNARITPAGIEVTATLFAGFWADMTSIRHRIVVAPDGTVTDLGKL